MDAITITQELCLESSDHQYAATGETDSERGLVLQDLTQKHSCLEDVACICFSGWKWGLWSRTCQRVCKKVLFYFRCSCTVAGLWPHAARI
jgi:hypothetical protein